MDSSLSIKDYLSADGELLGLQEWYIGHVALMLRKMSVLKLCKSESLSIQRVLITSSSSSKGNRI